MGGDRIFLFEIRNYGEIKNNNRNYFATQKTIDTENSTNPTMEVGGLLPKEIYW